MAGSRSDRSVRFEPPEPAFRRLLDHNSRYQQPQAMTPTVIIAVPIVGGNQPVPSGDRHGTMPCRGPAKPPDAVIVEPRVAAAIIGAKNAPAAKPTRMP